MENESQKTSVEFQVHVRAGIAESVELCRYLSDPSMTWWTVYAAFALFGAERETVYSGLGLSTAVRAYIGKCAVCRTVDVRQQKETMYAHDIPMRPWAKVGTDLFSFNNRAYLITVDYFSNFWEIDCLAKTSSGAVIHKVKAHFARHGIPDTVISNNGPQYSSQEFRQFSTAWEFRHVTSSSAYPQSNGKAESAVKMAKQLMGKAKRAKTDPYLAILEHRNTPSQGFNASPAQRLMSRRTKTLLPTHNSLLKPDVVNMEQAVKDNQCKQAFYYNRGAKDLRHLDEGEQVRVQLDTKHRAHWLPAKVERMANNRSYTVKLENGTVVRRNRKHLMIVPGGLQRAVSTNTSVNFDQSEDSYG
ncbi:hypothetical protein C0J45_7552 [Silurus meridionalis]|nr:hypothetical protein C0J45_7552 [Silurus meridionalis]